MTLILNSTAQSSTSSNNMNAGDDPNNSQIELINQNDKTNIMVEN